MLTVFRLVKGGNGPGSLELGRGSALWASCPHLFTEGPTFRLSLPWGLWFGWGHTGARWVWRGGLPHCAPGHEVADLCTPIFLP